MTELILIVAMAVLGTACSGKAPPAPEATPAPPDLVIQLEASDILNPDGSGRPSPIVLRVYQLVDAGPLASAEFFRVWDEDQKVFGTSPLWRQEVSMQPGGSEILRVPLESEARALAVVGAYRDVRHSRWSAMAPISVDPKSLPSEVRYLVSVGNRDLELKRSP